MGQNIENAKLVLQVISGLPKLDVEEAPRTNGLIEQDRSGWPPAAIDHRRREPSASPSTGTPVRPFRSRSSDRRRRSSRSKTRRSGSPRRRRLSRSPSGRSRRGEYEDCGDRRPRRADSSRSRSRQHRPEAEPQSTSALRERSKSCVRSSKVSLPVLFLAHTHAYYLSRFGRPPKPRRSPHPIDSKHSNERVTNHQLKHV